MTKICLLLTVAAIPLIHGAAVSDLVNLFHQYEDEILGRGQGVNPDPVEISEEAAAGRPVEVHGWADSLSLGQVSAVDVNMDNDPVIFQRGSTVWDESSFSANNVLNKKKVITEDTILVVDADKGRVKTSFGSGLFYMPHGLKVDQEDNIWVTDVGLHQVMKFNKGAKSPSLVLGTKFVPGNDASHFCKPTSVAVASNGVVFVADGYCNKRVAVFSPNGKHLHDIQGDWTIIHAVVLYEPEDVLCVADREGKKIDCVGAGLKYPQFRGQVGSSMRDVGRVYGLAGRGTALLAVTGKGLFSEPPRGLTIDLTGEENRVLDIWGQGLINPHDVAISVTGDAVYVAEIGPNTIRKFEVLTPEAEIF